MNLNSYQELKLYVNDMLEDKIDNFSNQFNKINIELEISRQARELLVDLDFRSLVELLDDDSILDKIKELEEVDPLLQSFTLMDYLTERLVEDSFNELTFYQERVIEDKR